MKNLRTLAVLAIVVFTATSAMAVDFVTSAVVEVVDGIVVTETTAMNFGQVALFSGTLVLSTNPATPIVDAADILFDDTGFTPAIWNVRSIVDANLDASFADNDPADGLDVATFTGSINGGTSNIADLTAHTQVATDDTWNVGATLTVDDGEAVVGVAAVGYTMTIIIE